MKLATKAAVAMIVVSILLSSCETPGERMWFDENRGEPRMGVQGVDYDYLSPDGSVKQYSTWMKLMRTESLEGCRFYDSYFFLADEDFVRAPRYHTVCTKEWFETNALSKKEALDMETNVGYADRTVTFVYTIDSLETSANNIQNTMGRDYPYINMYARFTKLDTKSGEDGSDPIVINDVFVPNPIKRNP